MGAAIWPRRIVERISVQPAKRKVIDDENNRPCPCPLCHPDVPQEVIAEIRAAAASPQGSRMTGEEFRAWLDTFDPTA